jgi:uncharacterized repeat protein (TIGR01451 family)
VTSTNGGTGSTATAALEVLGPDLAIAKTHAAPFVKGQTGTYTVLVSNLGPGPTSGTVTVADTLPAGLTATAIGGPGWTCSLDTFTCMRVDVLAAGASYPPITVTVGIAPTAPDSLDNTATVVGGGDVSPANNSVTDPTAVVAQIPTLGTWAFWLLAILLALAAVAALRRRRSF